MKFEEYEIREKIEKKSYKENNFFYEWNFTHFLLKVLL